MRINNPRVAFEYRYYELNPFEIYKNASKVLRRMSPDQFYIGANPNKILENLKDYYNYLFAEYHAEFGKNLMIIEPGDQIYLRNLADALSFLNPSRINSFLSFHKTGFEAKDNFENLIEFLVLDMMESYEFDNSIRYNEVMKWVKESRKDLIQTELPPIKKSYYWQLGETKLLELYESLLKKKLIDSNDFFSQSFENFDVDPLLCTTWLTQQRSLFYLLFLIFEKHDHNYESIGYIAFKLFKFDKSKNATRDSVYENYRQFRQAITSNNFPIEKFSSIKAIIDSLK